MGSMYMYLIRVFSGQHEAVSRRSHSQRAPIATHNIVEHRVAHSLLHLLPVTTQVIRNKLHRNKPSDLRSIYWAMSGLTHIHNPALFLFLLSRHFEGSLKFLRPLWDRGFSERTELIRTEKLVFLLSLVEVLDELGCRS